MVTLNRVVFVIVWTFSNLFFGASAPPVAQPAQDSTGHPLPQGAISRLGSLAFNHGELRYRMHFTPDAKCVISTGAGLIRVWDAQSGREIRSMTTPQDLAHYVETALRADGKTLVHLDNRHRVIIVDLETAKVREHTLVNPGKSQQGTFYTRFRNALSPNGELAATFSPTAIGVHGIDSGETLCQISANGTKFSAVAFAGNDRVVTAAEDQNIEVWDAKTGKSLRQIRHGAPAEYMVASEDGQYLAIVEHHVTAIDRHLPQDTVHVWDLTKGERLHRLTAANSWFIELRFAPNGQRLFAWHSTNKGYSTSVWDVATGKALDAPSDIHWFPKVFSPDQSRFISGRLMWDADKLAPINADSNPDAFAFKVWLSHTGDEAIVVGLHSISVWDASTGRRRRSFGVAPAYEATRGGTDRVISRDGKSAATYRPGSSGFPSHVALWGIAEGKLLQTIQPDPKPTQWQTTFSPDGQTMALWVPQRVGEQPIVQIWDLNTGQLARSFAEPKSSSFGQQISFASDGKTLVIYGGCIVGYDVQAGTEQFSWNIPRLLPDLNGLKFVDSKTGKGLESSPVRGLALAPDANLVACIQSTHDSKGPPDRTAVLLDGRTGSVLLHWDFAGSRQFGVDLLEFSADARLLAVSDGDLAHVFEVATGKRLHTLKGHRNEITRLAFSGNGRRLATAARDSTVLIWDIHPTTKDTKFDLEQCWTDLLSDDAIRAQAAVRMMMDSPRSGEFLSLRLKPAAQADQAAILQSISTLDDANFANREKANAILRKFGQDAVPALRHALSKPLSLEFKVRVQALLDSALKGPMTGESLRTWRAIPILEHGDSPECQRLLERLAGGAQGFWLTELATTSLTRVKLRK